MIHDYSLKKRKPKTCKPDPAAIVGCIISLMEAGKRVEKKYELDMSGEYNGIDEWMRCVYAVAVSFETWACANVDFGELEGWWPYMLEDQFGDACTRSYGVESGYYKNWTDQLNRSIAKEMDLPLKTLV